MASPVNKRVFRDGIGEIRVDIDGYLWQPRSNNEKTRLEIMGEVDGDSLQFGELDINAMQIAQ